MVNEAIVCIITVISYVQAEAMFVARALITLVETFKSTFKSENDFVT